MKKKGVLAALGAFLTFSIGTSAFATGGVNASVPVTLTANEAFFSINATVPSVLPVAIHNGKLYTADQVQIINHADYGAVQVDQITIKDRALHIVDYENFEGQDTIALSINGSPTKGEGTLNLDSGAFSKIPAGGMLDINYQAKVSSTEVQGEIDAADAVFIMKLVQ